MSIVQTKQKLKVLSTAGIKQVLVDVLIAHDTDIGTYDQEAGVIGYTRYVDRIVKQMKSKLERQVKGNNLKYVQTDLETLIKICKEEEEQLKKAK